MRSHIFIISRIKKNVLLLHHESRWNWKHVRSLLLFLFCFVSASVFSYTPCFFVFMFESDRFSSVCVCSCLRFCLFICSIWCHLFCLTECLCVCACGLVPFVSSPRHRGLFSHVWRCSGCCVSHRGDSGSCYFVSVGLWFRQTERGNADKRNRQRLYVEKGAQDERHVMIIMRNIGFYTKYLFF